jgi:hypothetical protein
MAKRKRAVVNQMKIRSAISNGTHLLNDCDHRSKAMRRLRDLLVSYENDLGGRDILSQGQLALLRRGSCLQLQAELMEQSWARNGGQASRDQLECYQRVTNSMRRVIESLGLNDGRKQRDVSTIDDDATYRAYQRELQRASP